MQPIVGYRITSKNGLDTFVQRPDHATYEIQQVIQRSPLNCIKYREGIYTIVPARTHAECPMWIVMYEVATQWVFTNRWSPYSPNVIECDHDKVKRFVIKGWYWTKEAADAVVEVFAEKHNYNQWATA